MQVQDLSDASKVRLHGRFAKNSDGIFMEWSGCCVEFFLTGSKADVTLTADHSGREQFVLIEIDGIPVTRFRPDAGTKTYSILDTRGDMESQELLRKAKRRIRIFKDTQANASGEGGFLRIDELATDGPISAPPARPRVEMIGDSLTSGEGTISPNMNDIGSEVACDEWCSFYHGWAGHLSRQLDTDWQAVSQGGWGVYCSWDNKVKQRIPAIYERVAGTVPEPVASTRGASEPYDFSYDPSVVIINLCTNDDFAFTYEPWIDPVTGVAYKLRQIEDPDRPDERLLHPDDAATVRDAIISFVKVVADRNPNAQIFWIYGMMRQVMWPLIEEAKDILRSSGLDRFDTILLPYTDPKEFGANFHPLSIVHARCATLIAEHIRPYLKK
jgi:hypothetical protein